MEVNKVSHYSASDIAQYFISVSNRAGRPVTNKKLQKLVYYSQAWYLVSNRGTELLFPEKIEAWIHGPVIPELYHQYKNFGFGTIPASLGSENKIDKEIKDLLDEVWNVYGKLDADSIESLSHGETPWIEARERLDNDEFADTGINPVSMTKYYSTLFS